eukprot:TRINITY_DN8896_c0_g2_i1.p1 TRINITY_DN8896_c0_g2~~TRINITY_DN8896_c0_g2_i1.p1  ORF type:complete len:1004 (+),score=244.85 TRINITY_DN8896_c0_g2_i1:105-3116(+)
MGGPQDSAAVLPLPPDPEAEAARQLLQRAAAVPLPDTPRAADVLQRSPLCCSERGVVQSAARAARAATPDTAIALLLSTAFEFRLRRWPPDGASPRSLTGLAQLAALPPTFATVAAAEERWQRVTLAGAERAARAAHLHELQRAAAAAHIQRVARGMPPRRHRRRQRAARTIQRSWRRITGTAAERGAVRGRLADRPKHRAATEFQRVWRGWWCRMTRARSLQLEQRSWWERDHVAARPRPRLKRAFGGARLLMVGWAAGLQMAQRQPLLRQLLLLRYQQRVEQRVDDPPVRRWCRRFAARTRVVLLRVAARKALAAARMQGLQRMWWARQRVRERVMVLRRETAAVRLQAWLRGIWRAAERHAQRCRDAPVVIQRWYRRRRARVRAQELAVQLQMVNNAAARIQALWRGSFFRSRVWVLLQPRLWRLRLGPGERALRQAMREELAARVDPYLPSKVSMATDARGHLQILRERAWQRRRDESATAAKHKQQREQQQQQPQHGAAEGDGLWPVPLSPTAGGEMPPGTPRSPRPGSPRRGTQNGDKGQRTPTKRYLGLTAPDWWNHRRLPGIDSPTSSDGSSDSSVASAALSVSAEVGQAWHNALARSRPPDLTLPSSLAPSPMPAARRAPGPAWASPQLHQSLASAVREAVASTRGPSDCVTCAEWTNSLRDYGGAEVGPLRRRRPAQPTPEPSWGSARWADGTTEALPSPDRGEPLLHIAGVPRGAVSAASSSESVASSLLESLWGPTIHVREQAPRRAATPHTGGSAEARPLRMQPPRRPHTRGGDGTGRAPARAPLPGLPGLSAQSRATLTKRQERRPVAGSHTAAAQLLLRPAPLKRPSRAPARPAPERPPAAAPAPPPAAPAPQRPTEDYTAVHGCEWGFLLLKPSHTADASSGTYLGTLDSSPPASPPAESPAPQGPRRVRHVQAEAAVRLFQTPTGRLRPRTQQSQRAPRGGGSLAGPPRPRDWAPAPPRPAPHSAESSVPSPGWGGPPARAVTAAR